MTDNEYRANSIIVLVVVTIICIFLLYMQISGCVDRRSQFNNATNPKGYHFTPAFPVWTTLLYLCVSIAISSLGITRYYFMPFMSSEACQTYGTTRNVLYFLLFWILQVPVSSSVWCVVSGGCHGRQHAPATHSCVPIGTPSPTYVVAHTQRGHHVAWAGSRIHTIMGGTTVAILFCISTLILRTTNAENTRVGPGCSWHCSQWHRASLTMILIAWAVVLACVGHLTWHNRYGDTAPHVHTGGPLFFMISGLVITLFYWNIWTTLMVDLNDHSMNGSKGEFMQDIYLLVTTCIILLVCTGKHLIPVSTSPNPSVVC